jgi:hypothetical protein
MTRLSGDFQTDLTLPSALGACADAVHSLGWKIDSLGGDHIASTAVSDQTGSEVTVEIELSKTPQGTDLKIIGTDSGADPLGESELADLLDQLGDAVEARIEETDAEEAEEEPRPDATPAAAATAVTQVQPADKGDWVRVDDRPAADEPAAEQAPAGWFPDPMADEGERYWDGEEWTHRVRAGKAEPPPEDKPKPTPSWWQQNRRTVLVGAFVFLLGGAIGAAATDGGKTTTVARTATKTARAKVRTETTTVTQTQSQPQTQTATTSPGVTTSPTGAVGATTSPAPSTGCDPSYANVCLDPKASDYDCKGEGDGPKFASGPVVIVGNDHFGLDGPDHDGVGCG